MAANSYLLLYQKGQVTVAIGEDPVRCEQVFHLLNQIDVASPLARDVYMVEGYAKSSRGSLAECEPARSLNGLALIEMCQEEKLQVV